MCGKERADRLRQGVTSPVILRLRGRAGCTAARRDMPASACVPRARAAVGLPTPLDRHQRNAPQHRERRIEFMSIGIPPRPFGSVARAFHWGMALLILVSLAMIEVTRLRAQGQRAARGPARLARPVWTRRARAGLVPAVLADRERRTGDRSTAGGVAAQAAHVVEWTFYALMVVLPVLGIAMLQADGKTVSLLGASLFPMVAVDKAWAHRLEDIHEWFGNAMMVLIGAHVGAAVAPPVRPRQHAGADVVTRPGPCALPGHPFGGVPGSRG